MDYIHSIFDYFNLNQIKIIHESSENEDTLNEYYINETKFMERKFYYIYTKNNTFYYDYDSYCAIIKIKVDPLIFNDFVFFLKKDVNFYLVGYDFKDIAVQTIERYWKKFRWNYLRNLAAWKYHPSKINFNV